MSLVVREITEKSEWERLHAAIAPHSFLHTWNWGVFREKSGETAYRVAVFDGEECLGIAQFIVVSARRGTFLLCPHGPLFSCEIHRRKEVMDLFVAYGRRKAVEHSCASIRICPLLERTPEHEALFHELGFRRAPTFVHPELTWILDIQSSPEELLAGMRKTTRYEIRKAEKLGVTIESSADRESIDRFYRIYQETTDRQHFVPFSRDYISREHEAFSPDNRIRFFFARYLDQDIATAVIVFTDDSAFYHHGASSKAFAKIPASHLLLWQVILEARSRGCALMNFYGIAPENEPKHPWAGLSLFKKGFGGGAHEYVSTQDLILRPAYWITYSIEALRRLKRRV